MNTQIEFVEALQSRFAVEHVKDNLKINLSQMAKPYGGTKRPIYWLRTAPAQEYLKELSEVIKITSADNQSDNEIDFDAQKRATADLLIVIKGGDPHLQGTWCTDYRIAMRFAQWLSPKFSIMVDTLIVSIMSKQLVLTEPTAKPIAGVWPIIENNIIGYPRKAILEASGYSSKKDTSKFRKKRFPQYHIIVGRVACYTPEYASWLHEYGKKRQEIRLDEVYFRYTPDIRQVVIN